MKKLHIVLVLMSPIILVLLILVSPFFFLHKVIDETKTKTELDFSSSVS